MLLYYNLVVSTYMLNIGKEKKGDVVCLLYSLDIVYGQSAL